MRIYFPSASHIRWRAGAAGISLSGPPPPHNLDSETIARRAARPLVANRRPFRGGRASRRRLSILKSRQMGEYEADPHAEDPL